MITFFNSCPQILFSQEILVWCTVSRSKLGHTYITDMCPQCHFSSNGEFLSIFNLFLAFSSLELKKKEAVSRSPLTFCSWIDAAFVTAGAVKHSGPNEDHLAKVEISQRPHFLPSPCYVPLPQKHRSVINTHVTTAPVCRRPYVAAHTVRDGRNVRMHSPRVCDIIIS